MKLADTVCIGLIAWAIFMILQGCAVVAPAASAAGAGVTHYRFTQLDERMEELENTWMIQYQKWLNDQLRRVE